MEQKTGEFYMVDYLVAAAARERELIELLSAAGTLITQMKPETCTDADQTRMLRRILATFEKYGFSHRIIKRRCNRENWPGKKQ